MKEFGKRLRCALGLLLALAVLAPIAGPGAVLKVSAVTQAEIDGLKGDASALDAQKKALEEQLKSIRADKSNAMARQRQISAQDEVKAQQTQADRLIEEINSQEDQLEAMEAELKKAAEALDAQIKAAEREYAAQISQVAGESGFRWPLDGGRNTVSSLWGDREDPISHQPGNHTGIDIPAPRNTPIYAAKSGVVTTSVMGSGVNWSYGNFVVVSHPDGTSTLYAHMSSRNVSSGQTVKQGEAVGYVGATGRSNGNHLHFEIRVRGERTDPLDYYQDKALYYQSFGQTVPLWDWM